MLDENIRRRSGEHVTQHAAAAAGDNADKDGEKGIQLASGYVCRLHADNGEYAETDSVKEKKRRFVQLLVPVQQPPHRGKKYEQGNGDRRERIPHLTNNRKSQKKQ